MKEGGSWEVRVSLAAVAQWMRSLGLLDAQTAFGLGPEYPPRTCPQSPELESISIKLTEAQRATKQCLQDTLCNRSRRVTAIKHAAELSVTPVREGEAPLELNTHSPNWLSQTED